MRNSLTKKQVREAGTLQLAYRFNELMHMGETMPAGIITMADAKETLWIEEELHVRLIKAVGHDFYPPALLAKPTISELKAKMKPTTKPILIVQPNVKTGAKIKFAIVATNSFGSKVAQFTVEANTKDEADISARKMIRKLGLTGVRYKIS